MNRVTCNPISGMRVLLVEDIASLRRAVRQMLEMAGAEVTEASTGGEAIGFVSAQSFDVVLTDLGLPDLSGEAVVAAIRTASGGRVPIRLVRAR